MRRLTIPAIVLASLLTFAACETEGSSPPAQASERAIQQDSYSRLAAAQPAKTMGYSPTRFTINRWVETWGQQGTLAFTYILNELGQKVGYYVFVGPPVSYCASLTPTYRFDKVNADGAGGADEQVQVPAPSIDGVYYSGGQCTAYYGVDAKTGQLIEFTAGGTLNYVTSTQPLYLDEVVPQLGLTSTDDVECTNGKCVVKA